MPSTKSRWKSPRKMIPSMTQRQANVTAAAGFDLLLGVAIFIWPVVFDPAATVLFEPWSFDAFYLVLMGRSNWWGAAFVASGAVAMSAVLCSNPRLVSLALGITAMLAVTRAISFTMAAFLIYPQIFVLLLSAAFAWARIAWLVWNAVGDNDLTGWRASVPASDPKPTN